MTFRMLSGGKLMSKPANAREPALFHTLANLALLRSDHV